MIGDEAENLSSRRLARIGRLLGQLHDDGFRNNYLSRQLKAFLAAQIRALRGEKTQAAFGKVLGKPQSVVSRLENERLSGLHVQTLIDIAQKLKIGVIIRFVEFSEFLRYTEDYSDEALSPSAYDQQKIDDLARRLDAPHQSALACGWITNVWTGLNQTVFGARSALALHENVELRKENANLKEENARLRSELLLRDPPISAVLAAQEGGDTAHAELGAQRQPAWHPIQKPFGQMPAIPPISRGTSQEQRTWTP